MLLFTEMYRSPEASYRAAVSIAVRDKSGWRWERSDDDADTVTADRTPHDVSWWPGSAPNCLIDFNQPCRRVAADAGVGDILIIERRRNASTAPWRKKHARHPYWLSYRSDVSFFGFFFSGKKTNCIDFDHIDVVNADLS